MASPWDRHGHVGAIARAWSFLGVLRRKPEERMDWGGLSGERGLPATSEPIVAGGVVADPAGKPDSATRGSARLPLHAAGVAGDRNTQDADPVTRSLAVVTAGLSRPSSTRLLADQLAATSRRELSALGARVETTVVEVRDHAHDLTDNLLTGSRSPNLDAAMGALASADGLIVVTPVFQASYSGLFKSFFDVVDTSALEGKPVLIAATGGTARHTLVLEQALRPLFVYFRAAVVPTAVYASPEDWTAAEPGTTPGSIGAVVGQWAGASGLTSRIERAAQELAREVDRRSPPLHGATTRRTLSKLRGSP